MDDIEQRLKDASESCQKAFAAWNSDKKQGSERDALMEAIHELRKVTARLEIEVAVSERSEMTAKPIPIPAHRSSRPHVQGSDDSVGNVAASNEGQSRKGYQGKSQSRGGPRRRSTGGGSKGGK